MLLLIILYLWAAVTVGLVSFFASFEVLFSLVVALLWPLVVPFLVAITIFEWTKQWLERSH
jgi:hypothetical protein